VEEEDATTSSKYYPELLCIDCFFEEEDEAEREVPKITSEELTNMIRVSFTLPKNLKNARVCKRR
jgi:hypothetical protein